MHGGSKPLALHQEVRRVAFLEAHFVRGEEVGVEHEETHHLQYVFFGDVR
jgi:hypothetical protein